jgi:hypothetical protein
MKNDTNGDPFVPMQRYMNIRWHQLCTLSPKAKKYRHWSPLTLLDGDMTVKITIDAKASGDQWCQWLHWCEERKW